MGKQSHGKEGMGKRREGGESTKREKVERSEGRRHYLMENPSYIFLQANFHGFLSFL